MKIKLALVGTSHISAIALAWRTLSASFEHFEPTFFAAPGKNFRRLQINGNKRFGIIDRSLFAPAEIKLLENTFGAATIELSEFDAVVHVGHNTLEPELATLINSFSIDGVRENSERPRMSADAFTALTEALAEQAVLPDEWRRWSKPFLYALPAPRVAESCAQSEGADYASWSELLNFAETMPIARMFEDYTTTVRKKFEENGINVIPVPSGIIAKSGLTHAQFTQDALRLLDGNSYPNTDHKHMNEAYGKLVLDHVLQVIQSDFGFKAASKTPTKKAAPKKAKQQTRAKSPRRKRTTKSTRRTPT